MTQPPDSNDQNQDKPADGDWFSQAETLRELAHLVHDEKLAELEISRGSRRVSLKKAAPPQRTAPAAQVEAVAPEYYAESDELDAAEIPTAAAPDANIVTVVSPMVGIFYRAPSPNDPNFVEVGARIEVGQTLGLVETMKVFNEITSEWEGTVVEVLAESSQLLETGDRLMTIRKS